jgi:hypothetical protein
MPCDDVLKVHPLVLWKASENSSAIGLYAYRFERRELWMDHQCTAKIADNATKQRLHSAAKYNK